MKLEAVYQIKINYDDWKRIDRGEIITFSIKNIDFQLLKNIR